MNRERIRQIALGLIAAFTLPVGLQAAFTPTSFFDDFPFGRGWIIGEGGGYDEHLVRDVGVLYLALIVVTAWAIWRRALVLPISVAWLLQGGLHLWYHFGHLDAFDGADTFLLIWSLTSVPILAGIALWTEVSQQAED